MQFKLGEINIICTNVDESLFFYRDILGFTSEKDKEGFYHLRCGDQMFLLLPGAKEKSHKKKYCNRAEFPIDLLVDDLKEAYSYFQEKNISISQEWSVGALMFVIRDPDGMHIEIIKSKI